MHIALLAGEASGDQLGAELIKSLRKINPNIQFDGVGGPLMEAEGFHSLLPIKDFSVMGITEIIKSLPRLLRHRRTLAEYYNSVIPDAFVGIDYPEFNLNLQKHFKRQGVYTAQYVSPSVWAWREERIHKIKQSTNLILTLFDFEKRFYDSHDMPAVYCGHPLVDMITLDTDKSKARQHLNLISHKQQKYLAVLPGSRHSEVDVMMPVYLQVMIALLEKTPQTHFIIPAATEDLKTYIESWMQKNTTSIDYRVFLRQGRSVMQAADAVLLTSGTATLEAMLLGRPMLVSYKVSKLTARMAKKRLKVKYFSLPNLLADKAVVPEFMQDDINPIEMAEKLHLMLTETSYRRRMIAQLHDLRAQIKTGAADNAANALYQDMLYREILPS